MIKNKKEIKNQFNIYHPIENIIILKDENAKKLIKVLRIKESEYFKALDGKGKEGIYIVKKIDKKTIIGELTEINNRSENKKITLVCGIVKRKALETLINFITQVGHTDIIIVQTENSIRIDNNEKEKIIERLKRISIEAIKQSEGFSPEIEYKSSIKDISYTEENTYLLLDKEGTKNIKEIYKDIKNRVFIFLGPEGDFSKKEKEFIQTNFKAIPVKLSENILRVETAGIVAISQLLLFI
ncbi:MAG TPA: RsmE family RNA methyltransferase [Spirochaetota bacterium]|nr:RsmE family RNA methyltransferase [Spirochaetota bacterium]HOM38052.1 RsmE family RNA methyltransferase [Spirochaetota bacterium]HPQ48856.1 RsmE family RNA methyltransferase [Spirochaetota bacterium]